MLSKQLHVLNCKVRSLKTSKTASGLLIFMVIFSSANYFDVFASG